MKSDERNSRKPIQPMTDHRKMLGQSAGRNDVASLSLLYESDDDRFALFEIFDGHLAAVDTSKLV